MILIALLTFLFRMLQAILSKTPYLNMDDEYFTESSHPNKNGDVFKKRKRPKFTDSF